MMGLKLYTDILENNIRVMAAMLICLFICGLMRIKSAKLKLLLMSLVWVRILIPLSIRFNIKIVSTDILSEVSYTDSVTGITINMYEILAVIWLLGIVVIFLHNMLADMKFRNGLSTSIPQEILAGGKRVKYTEVIIYLLDWYMVLSDLRFIYHMQSMMKTYHIFMSTSIRTYATDIILSR